MISGQETKIIALVPMKAHSERVPGKNTRPFCGQPLFHWILKSLHDSEYIHTIVIDTDSKAIADDALEHFKRVMIIDRPAHLRGDFIIANSLIAYDISNLKGEHFLQTHSTNPLLSTATIDKAIECYFSGLANYDSLFSVTRRQTRFYWPDGKPINHDPRRLIPTQNLDPLYEENSNFYVFSRSSFSLAGNQRIGLRPQMFEMNKNESVDIDEEQDFLLAEMICHTNLQKGRCSP